MKRSVIILYILVVLLAGWCAYMSSCDLRFDPGNTAGIIVSVLGVLVTFLVGWQIYSTIKAKDELKEIKASLDMEYGARIALLETANQQTTSRILSCLSMRGNIAVDTLTIGAWIEILDKIKDEKTTKLYKDVLDRLRAYRDSGERLDCSVGEFKRYLKIAKDVGVQWLSAYVRSFSVIGNNYKLSYSQQASAKL